MAILNRMGIINRYGMPWADGTTDLEIEIYAIRQGGLKEGLAFHYEKMRHILWPHLDGEHNGQRWHVLTRDTMLANKVTVLMGCASSGKTHSPAWMYLCDFYCNPDETLVLVSSTDIRGLELRVWGEIKSLHEKAIEAYDWLPGHLIDSKHCITSDDVEESGTRDLRKGIIGIPCVQNGKFVGLGKYCGIKQKRVRLIADEAQFMGASFLSAFANLNNNEDFRATILGNPNDILDPLGKAAEPLDGWTNHMEPTKTSVWKTRFMNGACVNLVGTDSPNFDFPENEPTRFKYLISKEKIAATLSFFAKDSIEYYSQCVGVMKIGQLARRVLTRDLCRIFHASDDVIWRGNPTVKLAALDAAYGGDRAVLGWAEFGEDIYGRSVLKLNEPVIVPILVNSNLIPEDQISEFVRDFCESKSIKPENFFHDSTGRGTLGTSLSRIWSVKCNPVEFGGPATERPVTQDYWTVDEVTNVKRLKTCYEHYVKFVTELWFSVRYTVEADQMRGMPDEVIEEFCMREWDRVKGDKIEIETKKEMKERVGRSPDLADWASIIVEGARRLGFKISKLAPVAEKKRGPDALDKLFGEVKELRAGRQLTAA